MTYESPLLWAIALGGAGILIGLYIFFRRWRQQRLVEDTPEAHVRSAPQGFVKLSGRARTVDGKVLRAPLSGRSCVWWSFRVDERGGDGWQGSGHGTSDQPFLLVDQDDQCVIDPEGAEVEPSDRQIWYGPSIDDAPPPFMTAARIGLGQKVRYTESILIEGAQLSVLGELRSSTGSITHALEDEAAVLLNQWKRDQPALLARFDVDHSGHIDAAEWEAARAAALTEAQQDRIQRAPEQRVKVLARPPGGQPFLIGARSSLELARAERRRALGGLALTVLSLLVTCYALAHVRTAGFSQVERLSPARTSGQSRNPDDGGWPLRSSRDQR